MLHQFTGLAIHEDQLNVFGRNSDNVLAVRGIESRELWNKIRELAQKMANRWSKATALGAGARYIIKHFDKLTPSDTYEDHLFRDETKYNYRVRYGLTQKARLLVQRFYRELEG